MINSLENLNFKMDTQVEMMKKVLNFLTKSSEGFSIQSYNFEFPLTSLEDLDKFESSLSQKEEFTKLVQFFNSKIELSLIVIIILQVRYLSGIGGGDYKECISNMLRRVMTDSLAVQFCYEGIRKTNPKRPFKDLKLKGAIFG